MPKASISSQPNPPFRTLQHYPCNNTNPIDNDPLPHHSRPLRLKRCKPELSVGSHAHATPYMSTVMSVKSTIQVPLGDEFIECTVSIPSTLGRAKISQFSSRASAALFDIANEIDHHPHQQISTCADGRSSSSSSTPVPIRHADHIVDPNVVSIQLRGGDGFTVWFKVRRYAALRKVMETYARQVGMRVRELEFVFEGRRVWWSCTPDMMGMEMGDVVDVVMV